MMKACMFYKALLFLSNTHKNSNHIAAKLIVVHCEVKIKSSILPLNHFHIEPLTKPFANVNVA